MKTFLLLLVLIIESNLSFSQDFNFRNVATGLDTPWEILWGPDGDIWFTERYGRISKVNPETGLVKELIRLNEVYEDGERGLMGMVLHPNFNNNPYVYAVFTHLKDNKTFITLIRLTYDGDKLSNPITLIDSILGAWNHDGSRLLIDDDLSLFMTIGDAAQANLAQDLNSLNGKILRLNLDGSIPEDNPYQNSYIWSWGHRNPQGLVNANGILYSSEHGPANDDELNIIYQGRNYGWPLVHGFCDQQSEKQYCQELNVVEPIAAWTPTLAVAGIDYYNKDLIPQWKNSILMVVLKSSRLVQIKLSEDYKKVVEENYYFVNQFGRLRDICISPDGRVFIATSNKDGRGNPKAEDDRIIELTPKGTGINYKEGDSGFNIYPNPANDRIFFRFSDNTFKQISIYDNFGRLILSKNIDGNYSEPKNIELKNFSEGLYFIKISNSQNIWTDKFLILRN